MTDPRIVDLCAALGLGSSPDTIIVPVRNLYDAVDREIEPRIVGLALPCRKGCDACCHESIFLSAPEFLVAAVGLLSTRSDEDVRNIHRAMCDIADRFSDELELLETLQAGPERDEVAARIKFDCPLLGSAGECTIYAFRELNAHTFGQSWDGKRDEPYGCGLTHDRLRVLGNNVGSTLIDARSVRQRLVDAVPGTEIVHVYPWWFRRYGRWLLGEKELP